MDSGTTTPRYTLRDRIVPAVPPNPAIINNIVLRNHLTPPKNFFDLPLELRCLIYHQILVTKLPFELKLPRVSDRRRSEPGTNTFRIQYSLVGPISNPVGKLSTRPRQRIWFLACKQMCREAIAQFQRGAVWTLFDVDYTAVPDGPQFSVWINVATGGRSQRVGPFLLTPSDAQDIRLMSGPNMHPFGEIDYHGKAFNKITWGWDAELMQRLNSSIAKSIKLRSFTVNVYTLSPNDWNSSGGQGKVPSVVDFKWLGKLELPQLQDLKLNMNYDSGFGADGRLLAVFDKATIEVGLKLIGGSGSWTSLRNGSAGRFAPRTQRGIRLLVAYTFQKEENYVVNTKKWST